MEHIYRLTDWRRRPQARNRQATCKDGRPPMSIPRLGVRTRLRAGTQWVRDLRHRARVHRLARGRPADYREYLDVQRRRTLSKRGNDPGVGARVLVGKVVEHLAVSSASSVLCVGCRNPFELDLFAEAGVRDVVGIDLVSQRHDILVMDMHAMEFGNDRFDAVYASHSLEHAYDVERVLTEIARVARPGAVVGIEVPLGPGSSDADRVEFGSVEDLRTTTALIARDELWADQQPAGSATNKQGTAVARLVVRV